jgi:hypothetical protein
MTSPADILRELKQKLLCEMCWRYGAVPPAGIRPSLQESFSVWEQRDGSCRLVLWFNLSSGTTKTLDRALPADLVDLVDARGNLVNKEAA